MLHKGGCGGELVIQYTGNKGGWGGQLVIQETVSVVYFHTVGRSEVFMIHHADRFCLRNCIKSFNLVTPKAPDSLQCCQELLLTDV